MSDPQARKVKGVVDMVFLLDATGSMGSCIDALKTNIELFIDKLVTPDGNTACVVKDWRAKVVGYRDFEQDPEPFVDNLFTRDAGELKGQLAALQADGGGDEPESLLDALFKVATMGSTEKGAPEDSSKWRYRSSAARVVIVFTDASYKDTMTIPDAAGGTINDLELRIHENRIVLSIFAPDMTCYNELAALDKAEYEPIAYEGSSPQQALVEFTADQEHFKETLDALAKSVSASASVETL